MGLGSENVISVPVLADGKMDPVALHKGFIKCDKKLTSYHTVKIKLAQVTFLLILCYENLW